MLRDQRKMVSTLRSTQETCCDTYKKQSRNIFYFQIYKELMKRKREQDITKIHWIFCNCSSFSVIHLAFIMVPATLPFNKEGSDQSFTCFQNSASLTELFRHLWHQRLIVIKLNFTVSCRLAILKACCRAKHAYLCCI